MFLDRTIEPVMQKYALSCTDLAFIQYISNIKISKIARENKNENVRLCLNSGSRLSGAEVNKKFEKSKDDYLHTQ